MSKLGQLKKQVGYEGNVPRCAICQYYRPAAIRLSTNSQTYRKNQHCGKYFFTIAPNSICDKWTGMDGAKLEEKEKKNV